MNDLSPIERCTLDISPIERCTLDIMKDGRPMDGPALVVAWFGCYFAAKITSQIHVAKLTLDRLKSRKLIEPRDGGWLYITEAGKRAT